MKTKLYLVLRNGLEKENKQKKMKKDKSTTYRKKSTSSAGAQTTSAVLSLCHSVHVWFVFRAETLCQALLLLRMARFVGGKQEGALYSRGSEESGGQRWVTDLGGLRSHLTCTCMRTHTHRHALPGLLWHADHRHSAMISFHLREGDEHRTCCVNC